MTVDDDPRLFYFTLGNLVRDLPDTGLLRVGQRLMTMPGRDWRAIGDLLGYTMTQMDPFERRPTPGYELLRDWSTRSGATIRVLQSKLQQITRHDIVSALDEIRQNPITLEVVIHDSSPPFDTPLTPEIRGRKELWDGLIDLLKSRVATVTIDQRYTLFSLRDTCMSWQGKCREYQGQQIDVNVGYQNTTTTTTTTPTGSAPGFCVRELQPSWHLMSPTQLRYTRNVDCNVEAGTTSPNGAGARPSSGSFGPDTDAKGTGRQDPRAGRAGQSEVYKSCIRESSCNMDAAESLEKLKTKVTFSNEEESSGNFHRIKNLFTQKAARYIPETVKTKFDLEAASVSLNIDLRSCEGPPDRRKVSHHENTRTKPINFNLRSDETLPENLEADVALFGSESPTICLKSDDSLSENCLSDVRDQQISSAAMVAMSRSFSTAGPGDGSDHELMELHVRLDDLRLENESSVSGGFVKEEEETKSQQSNSITRRHVYFLPKAELVRSQFPGLWDLPGFHPKLKHKISLISEVMKPYEKNDGCYLIRAFGSDDNMAKVDLALTVTHKGKLKHFMILQLLCGSIHRRYFLFSRDFEAKSISDLIDHYKQHPLIPGSLSARGTNFPRLISPIPRDSFNYM